MPCVAMLVRRRLCIDGTWQSLLAVETLHGWQTHTLVQTAALAVCHLPGLVVGPGRPRQLPVTACECDAALHTGHATYTPHGHVCACSGPVRCQYGASTVLAVTQQSELCLRRCWTNPNYALGHGGTQLNSAERRHSTKSLAVSIILILILKVMRGIRHPI